MANPYKKTRQEYDTISLYIGIELLKELDKKRGDIKRSTYIVNILKENV